MLTHSLKILCVHPQNFFSRVSLVIEPFSFSFQLISHIHLFFISIVSQAEVETFIPSYLNC